MKNTVIDILLNDFCFFGTCPIANLVFTTNVLLQAKLLVFTETILCQLYKFLNFLVTPPFWLCCWLFSINRIKEKYSRRTSCTGKGFEMIILL